MLKLHSLSISLTFRTDSFRILLERCLIGVSSLFTYDTTPSQDFC